MLNLSKITSAKNSSLTPAQTIQKKLEKGHEIMPFPAAVGRLLSALKDPTADSQTFAKIIEADPALSARLLRMANSPIYGLSNVIRSIDHATTVLGQGPLKNLALIFAGSSVFSGKDKTNEQREALWDHSLGCATLARLLAKSISDVQPDEAFLAGIFHDVGKLFFYDCVADHYLNMVQQHTGKQLIAAESELFEITHEEVGVRLITAWQLPEQIMVAVGYHHQPENAIAHKKLTSLIYVADSLSHAVGIGSPADPNIDILGEANELLGLSDVQLKEAVEQAFELYDETKQAYSD